MADNININGIQIPQLPTEDSPSGFDAIGYKSGRTSKVSLDTLATKAELQDTVVGTNLLGSKANVATIKSEVTTPQKGDTYKATDTGHYWKYNDVISETNPYDPNKWVDIDIVIPSDVMIAGGITKTGAQLDNEKADKTITVPSIISDRTKDINTWNDNALITYDFESQVFGKKEFVTKVVDNQTVGGTNPNFFSLILYYPNEFYKIDLGDRIGIAFNFYSPINTKMNLFTFPDTGDANKVIDINVGINFINYEFVETTFGNERQIVVQMPITAQTFYIQRALVYKGFYKNLILADYPTYEDIELLNRKAPIVPISIISDRTKDINTWNDNALITYDFESQVFGKKEFVTKVVDNQTVGGTNPNFFSLILYYPNEFYKIDLGDRIGIAFNFYSPINTKMNLFTFPDTGDANKVIDINVGINFINYEFVETTFGNERQIVVQMPITAQTFYIQRAVAYRGILSNPSIPIADSILPGIQCFGDSLTAQNYAQYITQITGRLATPYGYGGQTSTYIRDKFFELADKSKTQIIWAGRNNLLNIDSVVNDIRAMVDSLGHNRFIICNPPNGNGSTPPYAEGKNDAGNLVYEYVVELENRLRNEYQDNFLNIRKAIINGWDMGNVRLLSSFTQPAIGSSVQISVSDATFLTTYNQSDLAEWGTVVMNYIRIGFIGLSDKYEIVSKDSNTLLTIKLTEANRIQPGNLVQNMQDAGGTGSTDSIVYLNVFQNADLKCYLDDRPLSTFRADNVHFTDRALRYIAKVMSRKLEIMKI